MAIKVTVTVVLDDDWITDEDADDESDAYLKELCMEDPFEFLRGGKFKFERHY